MRIVSKLSNISKLMKKITFFKYRIEIWNRYVLRISFRNSKHFWRYIETLSARYWNTLISTIFWASCLSLLLCVWLKLNLIIFWLKSLIDLSFFLSFFLWIIWICNTEGSLNVISVYIIIHLMWSVMVFAKVIAFKVYCTSSVFLYRLSSLLLQHFCHSLCLFICLLSVSFSFFLWILF